MKRFGTIRPRALSEDADVYLFAPGTAVKEPFKSQGMTLLAEAGFRIHKGQSLDATASPFAAGSPDLRLRDWNTALSLEMPALLPARGGYGCVHLLPQAPLQATARLAPLWVGASDCTYLQIPLLQNHGLVTLYGPMPCGQLANPQEPGRRAFIEALHGKLPESYTIATTLVLQNGTCAGELRGGCLSIVAALCGTSNQLDARDAILVLEDVGEHPYRIERMLYQLQHAGIFDACAGVAFGTFPNCTDRSGNPDLIHDVLHQFVKHMNKPVLSGLPIGHGSGALPLPLGTLAEIKAGTLRLCENPML